jgi:hypothetical protein
MKTGRRSFLKGVGGATAAAFAVGGKGAEAGLVQRPTLGSRQVLELDGEIVGAPQSSEGGGASAIVNGSLDSALVVRKDVTGVTYDPISVGVGLGMGPAFFDWVRGFFERDFQRRNGAIISADFNYRELSRREFQDALVTEVAFPTLDGGSKEPAFMTVKLQPESTQFKPGSGGKVTPPAPSKAKNWLVSNFDVELSGLESATKRVSKVDGFAVKTKFLEQEGEIRPFESQPYLEVPNLVLSVPTRDVQPFVDWFEDFVIKGNAGPENERKGAIVCLAPNQQDELLRIELLQVGIVSIGETNLEANSEQVRRFRVELYVEEMKLQIKAGAVS